LATPNLNTDNVLFNSAYKSVTRILCAETSCIVCLSFNIIYVTYIEPSMVWSGRASERVRFRKFSIRRAN